jgi:hypothetical protein
MPKTVYFPISDDQRRNSGIDITWTKSRQSLWISGWYDSFVGIEGQSVSLREFFDLLGITEKDCRKAFAAGEGE